MRSRRQRFILRWNIPVTLLFPFFLEAGELLGLLKFSGVNKESTDGMFEFKGGNKL